MAGLVRIDARRNMFRRYRAIVSTSLFGPAVEITWGRIGSAGRGRTEFFGTVEEAEAAWARIIAAKLRKGYCESGIRE